MELASDNTYRPDQSMDFPDFARHFQWLQCNYKLEVLDQTTKTEIMDSKPTILTHKDIQLYVDPVSEFYVLGTSIDYISGNYEKGIFESMFISRSVQTMRQVVGVGVSFTSNKC